MKKTKKETKLGRPVGTTRANGYKVAVDSPEYWINNNYSSRKVTVDLGFLAKVSKGLEVFLSPYTHKH